MPQGDLWNDANVLTCLDYALSSKFLVIPQEYQEIFPTLFSFNEVMSN